MKEYHKINAPFKRNNDGDKKLIMGDWALPEFEYLQNNDWIWTEKIDGTNIRIIFQAKEGQGHPHFYVGFASRTDNADIPPHLRDALDKLFSGPRLDMVRHHMNAYGITEMTLYGEGYGPKIQGGGKYRDTPGFVLFDVRVGDWWLQRDAVEDISNKLDLDVVPVVMEGSIHQAIEVVKTGVLKRGCMRNFLGEDGYLPSAWGEFEAEGLVGTPLVPLFNRKGERIVVKVKARDFRNS